MFQRILVAIDDPELSGAAFKYALELAQKTEAHLLLLHVLARTEVDYPAGSSLAPYYYPAATEVFIERYHHEWQAAKERGEAMLKTLAETAAAQGVVSEFSQNVGDPGQLICKIADNWNADLIMLQRRGLTGLREWVAGSVSNYVFHHAPCPVLVIQGIPIEQDLAPVADQTAIPSP